MYFACHYFNLGKALLMHADMWVVDVTVSKFVPTNNIFYSLLDL